MKTTGLIALLLFATYAASGQAQSPSAAARAYFTDLLLQDQNGANQRLYSDLLADKVVIVSTFFTHCETSCPITAAKFSALQSVLSERLGGQVNLLLLSTDPERDSPARLQDYARKLNARDGWYFLTGDADNLALALQKFGQSTATPELHKNEIIVGNSATGLWHRAKAIVSPQELLQLVEQSIADS